MTAADNIFERSDTRFDEGFIHILAHIARRRSIERQIAALGADNELVARNTIRGCERLQGPADGTFTSLKTIICSAVDNVYAELNGANDGVGVVCISRIVCISEIRADADR